MSLIQQNWYTNERGYLETDMHTRRKPFQWRWPAISIYEINKTFYRN